MRQWGDSRGVDGTHLLDQSKNAVQLVERIVGLLFDSPMAADVDLRGDAMIRLLSSNGSTPSGQWVLNSNRRMLLFKNLKPGRYTVIVSPQLANEAGQTLGTELHGPVYIR